MILSPYLIAAIAGWVIAQGSKYVITALRQRDLRSVRHLYISGGMPSAHSATVVAVTTVIGLIDGFQTGLFALSLLFAMIVMYDAVMVRRSSGKQGDILHKLLDEVGSKLTGPRIARGHEPLEVVVGAGVGVAIGCIVFLATR